MCRIICDICHKEIPVSDKVWQLAIVLRAEDPEHNVDNDVCTECINKLKAFIKQESK